MSQEYFIRCGKTWAKRLRIYSLLRRFVGDE
jgi:hypothetical protein